MEVKSLIVPQTANFPISPPRKKEDLKMLYIKSTYPVVQVLYSLKKSGRYHCMQALEAKGF